MEHEQVSLYDILGGKSKTLNLHSEVVQDEITREISKSFDYEFTGGWLKALKFQRFLTSLILA